MTTSKPNVIRLSLLKISLFIFTGLLCLIIIEWMTGVMSLNTIALTFTTILTIFVVLLFILIELPVAVQLTIDENNVVVKNLLTKKNRVFSLDNIHSCKISIKMSGNGRLHLDLVLFSQGEPVTLIPLQYISNLDDIIKELEQHLRNLTEDEYGYLKALREQQQS